MAAHQAPPSLGFSGKNTGVGCHFLLQCMKVKSESEVTQLCPTLRNPWTAGYQAPLSMGFPRQEYWSGLPLPDVKDTGLIPGSGRLPKGGHGNPLQYSCLDKPMDRKAWRSTAHKVTVGRDWRTWLSSQRTFLRMFPLLGNYLLITICQATLSLNLSIISSPNLSSLNYI